jgi:hypothetical protein
MMSGSPAFGHGRLLEVRAMFCNHCPFGIMAGQ